MSIDNKQLEITLDVLSHMSDTFSDKEIADSLIEFGIDNDLATYFSIFTPIVFFRLMLPNFNFPMIYNTVEGKELSLSDNLFYSELYLECSKLFNKGLDSDYIFKSCETKCRI